MAQNEMKAKPALPERVRSMEGLGLAGSTSKCNTPPRTRPRPGGHVDRLKCSLPTCPPGATTTFRPSEPAARRKRRRDKHLSRSVGCFTSKLNSRVIGAAPQAASRVLQVIQQADCTSQRTPSNSSAFQFLRLALYGLLPPEAATALESGW